MATCEEMDGVEATFSLGHAGHCFLLQCFPGFHSSLGHTLSPGTPALTSATTALSIPKKMLQNWAFPVTHYLQFYI